VRAFAVARLRRAIGRVLALIGAAVVVTERSVPATRSRSTRRQAPINFSSTVHLAAVIVIGPGRCSWHPGVLVVDGLRSARLRQSPTTRRLRRRDRGRRARLRGAQRVPARWPAVRLRLLTVLALTYYLVNTLFISAIIAFDAGTPVLPAAPGVLARHLRRQRGRSHARPENERPWAIVALVPLVFAVYCSHARLATLRRGPRTRSRPSRTSSTGGTSRSALGARVGRPPAGAGFVCHIAVASLRWAGRLHDLRKVGVDMRSSEGRARPGQWIRDRRRPRLSRASRRFRFAAGEARAVEYHHERYDGSGYYRVDPSEIPLAAHFLIVADTYDADERPSYREALPPRSLAEIEAGAGTQFHPAVAGRSWRWARARRSRCWARIAELSGDSRPALRRSPDDRVAACRPGFSP
jgi:hypothetical protein